MHICNNRLTTLTTISPYSLIVITPVWSNTPAPISAFFMTYRLLEDHYVLETTFWRLWWDLAKVPCISSSTLTISTSAGSSVQTCWTEEKNCRTYIAMLFRRILHFFITVPASVLSFSGTRVWTSSANLSILSRIAWKSFAICVWCPTDLRNAQNLFVSVSLCF